MFNELKEGKMTKSHQMENNNKEMEILKRNKMKILQLKSRKKERKKFTRNVSLMI